MTEPDSIDLAAEAGLRCVEPDAPGYRRVRRGKGFSYLGPEGQAVNVQVRSRIESLAIPPAWKHVWISRDPRAHILATGYDKAGRKQYIYHHAWEQVRDEVKFDRLEPFGRGLAGLRRRVDSDLSQVGPARVKVVALAVAVLDRTLIRVGNRRYAAHNGSYGLTTLTCEHIEVDGRHVHFEFAGKGGAEHQLAIGDRRLASLVSDCQELAGQTLLRYETGDGEVSSITSSDVNNYLSDVLRGPFTAKDVRTWGASSLVTGELAETASNGDNEDSETRAREAIDAAAERLGNTRAVCRDSYVHPLILEANEDSRLADVWSRAKSGKWTSREESTLRLLLEGSPQPLRAHRSRWLQAWPHGQSGSGLNRVGVESSQRRLDGIEPRRDDWIGKHQLEYPSNLSRRDKENTGALLVQGALAFHQGVQSGRVHEGHAGGIQDYR
jgi:DNA topoisomerase-1